MNEEKMAEIIKNQALIMRALRSILEMYFSETITHTVEIVNDMKSAKAELDKKIMEIEKL